MFADKTNAVAVIDDAFAVTELAFVFHPIPLSATNHGMLR